MNNIGNLGKEDTSPDSNIKKSSLGDACRNTYMKKGNVKITYTLKDNWKLVFSLQKFINGYLDM